MKFPPRTASACGAEGGLVDDVVVQERGGVDHLDDLGKMRLGGEDADPSFLRCRASCRHRMYILFFSEGRCFGGYAGVEVIEHVRAG